MHRRRSSTGRGRLRISTTTIDAHGVMTLASGPGKQPSARRETNGSITGLR
jgi:hypothetical protein